MEGHVEELLENFATTSAKVVEGHPGAAWPGRITNLTRYPSASRLPRSCWSGRPGSVRSPARRSPFCTRCLLVRLDDRAVNENILKVELIRQLIENTFEDTRNSPAAEPLEHAVPVAETLRKVAPKLSRPGLPKHGLKKLPIVHRGDAGIGRLAGPHGLDPPPNVVGQYRPVCIHKVVHERRSDQ